MTTSPSAWRSKRWPYGLAEIPHSWYGCVILKACWPQGHPEGNKRRGASVEDGMERKEELLRMAADAFDDLRNPFESDTLRGHNVTLDEAGDLSIGLAVIVRGYLNCPKEVRHQILVAGALDGALDPQNVDVAVKMLRKQQAMEKIKTGGL